MQAGAVSVAVIVAGDVAFAAENLSGTDLRRELHDCAVIAPHPGSPAGIFIQLWNPSRWQAMPAENDGAALAQAT